MRYPFFRLSFSTRARRKTFSVVANCTRLQGLTLTAYWGNVPIFNLLSDLFAEHPSPLRHKHEWGIVRWGKIVVDPSPFPRNPRFPDEKTPGSAFVAKLDEELLEMSKLSEKSKRES